MRTGIIGEHKCESSNRHCYNSTLYCNGTVRLYNTQ